jgi:hypothetical protein
MLMKWLVLVLFSLLSACQNRRTAIGVHLRIGESAARATAIQVGGSLRDLEPVALYDEEIGSINIAFVRARSYSQVLSRLSEIGMSPSRGLDRPTTGFLARVECARQRACDLEGMTQCVFSINATQAQYEASFELFSRRVSEAAYPILAVLYRRVGENAVELSVPLYDQCEEGREQLTSVWQEISRSDGIFQRSASPHSSASPR